MEDVICRNCGSINDYRTSNAGPHVKATCNGCDKYIKFLSQTNNEKMAEQKNDELLPGGLRFFNPNPAAPDFVVGQMVITMEDLFAYTKKHPELCTEYEGKKQLKINLLISKNDKLYGKVDDYKKDDAPAGKRPPRPGGSSEPLDTSGGQTPSAPAEDDLPF